MLVECPNCHRRYEPKPNEKYCPCCGEEITAPLKNIEPEPKIVEKEVIKTQPVQTRRNPIVGRLMSLVAVIAAFVSFLFAFGPAYTVTSGYTYPNSLIQLTFYSKQAATSSSSKPQAYVGLIIAFVIFMIMLIICIYEIYKIAKNEADGARIAIGVIEVFLILFYAIYLVEKSKVTNSGYGSSVTTTAPLGDGVIRMLVTLGISALLNFVSPLFDLE